MIKNGLMLTIISALVVVTVVFWDTSPQALLRDTPLATTTAQQFPSSVILNSTTRSYESDGQLASILKASESRHFQGQPEQSGSGDYSILKAPNLTFFSVDSTPWNITSDQGTIKAQGELIELQGNVRIWQAQPNGDTSELNTTFLVVKPSQQYAETDKAVKIDAPGNITLAQGMQAFLKEDRVVLLSQVRGTHEP